MFIAITLVSWSNQPEFRPLVKDLNLTQSVKIADILDQNSIRYYADIKSHMLYVTISQTEEAKIALAKHGILIDYPRVLVTESLQDSFDLLSQQLKRQGADVPIYQQEWFMPVIKIVSSALVIIVLILAIVRPALRALIYPEDNAEN